ncbi:hypothetical protein [Natrinema sp. SYSU A 869]|uniref:hypothetical protein n=1 Tax=Natrinema sp. SYSU A 869 TaxID=2871694 RepID=UPI001CA41E4B|nr:hypothetical protein [Natrinema sp. SYSU A 869]
MTDGNPIEEQYSYDGWLVFNELFDTTLLAEGIGISEVVETFPSYEGGAPNDPDNGFEHTELSQKIQSLAELSDGFERYAENLHAFKYVDEDWVQEWGYDEEANQQIFYRDKHDEVEIFWDSDNEVMMFRGDQQLLERKRKSLRSGLSGSLELDPVDFDFDFFLWVLYKKYKGEELSADLRVRNLTRGKTIGDQKDNLGRQVQVEGSENIIRSLMLIAPVLAGKKIKGIQGQFVMESHTISAEIQHGGKVHVKVSNSPLSGLSHLRRMGIALRFLSELIRLFSDWEELPDKERYPPASFFDELGDIAEEEGWDLQYDPREIKDEYRRKRGA